MVTKTLAGMDVGYVEFHNRHINAFDCIMKCDGRVGISASIDGHATTLETRFVDPADQFAFVVALMTNYVETMFFAESNTLSLDISKGLRSIDARLTLPEQVQVRSI